MGTVIIVLIAALLGVLAAEAEYGVEKAKKS
jgi:hypothetical protein